MRLPLRGLWSLGVALLVLGVLSGNAARVSADAPPVQVGLEATAFLSGSGGWFSGGDGGLFRAFLVPGTDPNGAIWGTPNACGQGWVPFPPMTLGAGTHEFTMIGTGTPAPMGDLDVWFGGMPTPITVTTELSTSAPTPVGGAIVTVSNFTLAASDPYLDRVGSCAVGADSHQDAVVRFTVTVAAPVPPPPALPATKDECKNGGWQSFGVFKNQGDCVSYVASGGKNLPG